jgi:hypothetical protein
MCSQLYLCSPWMPSQCAHSCTSAPPVCHHNVLTAYLCSPCMPSQCAHSCTSAPPVCHHNVLTAVPLVPLYAITAHRDNFTYWPYPFTHENLITFLQIELHILCQLLYVVGWHIGRSFAEKESVQGTNGWHAVSVCFPWICKSSRAHAS